MLSLYKHASCSQNTTVYIGNYAAQNGVSRFGEQCDSLFERRWNYVKTENLTVDKIRDFNMLLVEPKDEPSYRLTHKVTDKFYAYAGPKFSLKPPFVHIKKKEAIYLMKSKKIKKKVEIFGS